MLELRFNSCASAQVMICSDNGGNFNCTEQRGQSPVVCQPNLVHACKQTGTIGVRRPDWVDQRAGCCARGNDLCPSRRNDRAFAARGDVKSALCPVPAVYFCAGFICKTALHSRLLLHSQASAIRCSNSSPLKSYAGPGSKPRRGNNQTHGIRAHVCKMLPSPSVMTMSEADLLAPRDVILLGKIIAPGS